MNESNYEAVKRNEQHCAKNCDVPDKPSCFTMTVRQNLPAVQISILVDAETGVTIDCIADSRLSGERFIRKAPHHKNQCVLTPDSPFVVSVAL